MTNREYLNRLLESKWTIILNVRVRGSLGVFDPASVTVVAPDRESAIATATRRAHSLGWETAGYQSAIYI